MKAVIDNMDRKESDKATQHHKFAPLFKYLSQDLKTPWQSIHSDIDGF